MQNVTAVYVVKPEFITELCSELPESFLIGENLVVSSCKKINVCFAQDIWLEPQVATFQSISQASQILRQTGKWWYPHPISHIRRSHLIGEQLVKLPPLLRPFPIEKPLPPIGAFGLLDKNTMIFSSKRLRAWPEGKCLLIEDKVNPPNRAYLKLWEALTLLGRYPKPNETVLDLGASPGGWTYVMQSFGAQVTAVDKALLAPTIARLPGVTYLQQSGFALEPKTLNQPYDWLLSDIACYPDKTYALIMKWLNSGKAKQMIITIKLQGKIDLKIIEQFQNIPNSYITNLYHNKHEATFFYPNNA